MRMTKKSLIISLLAVVTLLLALAVPYFYPRNVCLSSLRSWFQDWQRREELEEEDGHRQQSDQLQSSKHQSVERFRIASVDSLRPSSVWCSENILGTPSNCRFDGLCLNLATQEYFFALDTHRSIFYPPKLRTVEKKLELGQHSPVIDHNLFAFKYPLVTVPYSDMEKLVNKTTSIYFIPGNTLIASRFKPDSWMHLLHDDLLPLYATMHHRLGGVHHLGNLFLDDHWTSDDHDHHFLSEIILKTLYGEAFPLARGLFPHIHNAGALVCFEQAFIGLTNATAWYQYGFRRPQGPVERTVEERAYIRATITAFRASLFTAFKINPEALCPKTEDRWTLLLTRVRNRRILNVEELFRRLQQRRLRFNGGGGGGGSNLRLLMLDKHRNSKDDIAQLLTAFACAQGVIGMHGSELALSLLMAPGGSHTKKFIIELFPYGVDPLHFTPFRSLATSLLGHRYYAWRNDRPEDSHFPDESTVMVVPGLAHLSPEELRKLQETIDQPLQNEDLWCCDQPAWLYRIYQDTRVDPESLQKVLKDVEDGEGDKEEGVQITSIFRLSDVTDLQCSTTANNSRLTIDWRPPWNLPFLHDSNLTTSTPIIKYEVLIQQPHQSEGLVISTRETSIKLPSSNDLCQFSCHIWVKPIVKVNFQKYRVIGHFSRSPLLCKVQ